MEENKAKTTEAEEMIPVSRDGADADAVTSEGAANAPDAVGDTPEKDTQALDVNRENARHRREEERLRQLEKERERAIIETLGGKNPFDGSEMRDGTDVRRFLEMKRDYLEREEAARVEEEERNAWFDADREAFFAAYPDVDTDALIGDERFRRFSEGKVGHVPMKEIYESYRAFLSAFDEKAKSLAAQALANSASGIGALGGTRRAEGDSFTADEVRRMSPREVRENYEKIRHSMSKW